MENSKAVPWTSLQRLENGFFSKALYLLSPVQFSILEANHRVKSCQAEGHFESFSHDQ